MTLNSSGPISLAGTTAGVSIEIENGGNGTTQISLNDTAVRSLAGVTTPGSTIIMPTNFYGKSNVVNISSTFTSNTANASLNVNSISGYSAGKSNITVTVNSNVYLYATSTGNYGLNLSGGTSGDTLTLVNNGYIMGQGGKGGGNYTSPQTVGGPALNVGTGIGITINNGSGYIGGGGGGGGFANYAAGGGAGGGDSGGGSGAGSTGGSGGGPGSSGGNGSVAACCGCYWGGGGGGGRIMPGSGGAGGCGGGSNVNGKGGGAGGGGGTKCGQGNGGAGGSAGNAGSNAQSFTIAGGGGGGYGAKGGNSHPCYPNYVGANGGKAINKNGNTVTFSSGCGRVYGAIS